MKRWTRCGALLLALLCCLGTLTGCARDEEGIALAVCVGSQMEELDPIYAVSPADKTVLLHVYENLMRTTVDVSGATTVTNGLTKSVDQEENHDGTVTWTFRLRSAKWSDGRNVTAGDFVYAWQRLADPANHAPNASLLSVVAGYDTVRSTGDVTALQVTAKNDSTLEVVLTGTYDWFLTEVCTAPATLPVRQDVIEAWETQAAEAAAAALETEGAEETAAPEIAPWWADVTALPTNGVYQAASYTEEALVLSASETYSGSHTGPRELTFRFAGTPEEAWALYQEKAVDFVWQLTNEEMAEQAQEETWRATPELGTYTVLFNCTLEPLTDPLVRQALALVIDRTALAEAAGPAASAAEGLVSPGVPEDDTGDFRTVGGPALDNDPENYAAACEQARELLEGSGHSSGADLGELEYLYVDRNGEAAVAQAICSQWSQTLRARITPRAVTEEELQTALRDGSYALAGVPIQPMGNDAECFLTQWVSGSDENVTGYANSAYDTLMSIIAQASDGTARMGCLHDAEELLLSDCALAPLYTTVTDWELRDDYTGLSRDARGWFSFASVIDRI